MPNGGDLSPCSTRKKKHSTHSDLLVRFLSITTLLDKRHDDIFRRHERQFLRDPPPNDLRVYHQALRHVLQRREHYVRSEERLWQRHPPICAVVKRALEPLYARRPECVLMQRHKVSR